MVCMSHKPVGGEHLKPDVHYTFATAVRQLEMGLIALLVFGCAMPGVTFLSSAADMTQNIFARDAGESHPPPVAWVPVAYHLYHHGCTLSAQTRLA